MGGGAEGRGGIVRSNVLEDLEDEASVGDSFATGFFGDSFLYLASLLLLVQDSGVRSFWGVVFLMSEEFPSWLDPLRFGLELELMLVERAARASR